MKLFHFCGRRFVESILREGLTKGTFPKPTKLGWDFTRFRQWLTEEPDANKQSWATRYTIHYGRTDCRLIVDIPDEYMGNLKRAVEYVQNMPREHRRIVTDWPGSDKWFIYIGVIPPEWITLPEGKQNEKEKSAVRRKSKQADSPRKTLAYSIGAERMKVK